MVTSVVNILSKSKTTHTNNNARYLRLLQFPEGVEIFVLILLQETLLV